MDRRRFLAGTASGLIVSSLGFYAPRAYPQDQLKRPTRPRLVWIVLRGGMDSLHTVIPTLDPHLMDYRASLLEPIMDDLLPLDQDFALHPSLPNLHSMFVNKEFSPWVGVATGYRGRSHFSAQDVLESGRMPATRDEGWIARFLQAHQLDGVAISLGRPLSVRGTERARSFAPGSTEIEDGIQDRMRMLYASDPKIRLAFERSLDFSNIDTGSQESSNRLKFENSSELAGRLLAQPDGPDVVMLELGGWDTHNRQEARLARKLAELDKGLSRLKASCADGWQDTLVLVATEFGRTVAINGTKGTDHGTASSAFVINGGGRQGQVKGNWPSLQKKALLHQRDLRPTTPLFEIIDHEVKSHFT